MLNLRTLFMLLWVAISGSGYTQNSEKGIFVDPATIDFNLLNGQSGTAKVKIINQMDVKKQFKIYLNDWQRDTVGQHHYVEPGTLPISCSRWISLDRSFVELNPGEMTEVTVKLTVPDSVEAVKGMRWSMLFIETVEEKKTPTRIDGILTAIQTSYRIGVHVYQTPPTRASRELQMLSFAPKANSSDSVYRIECKNTGDAQLHCKSYIELLNTANGQKTRLAPVEFPMFPQQVRYVDFVLPASLANGKYTALAAVDAGEDVPLEAAEKTIEINR